MGKDEATQKAAAFDELAFTVSQLLHGEQAALQLCGQLTNVCEKMDQKWYAASQVIDEARHVEVMARFLSSKMGTIYPIGGTLKVLLDMLLEADRGCRRRSSACRRSSRAWRWASWRRCGASAERPLRRACCRLVESGRGAARGLRRPPDAPRSCEEASQEEMAEMEDWSFGILEALNANQQLDMLHVLGPKYGIEPDMVVQTMTALPNFAEINSMVYMHTVVPNLHRLGLITERTESGWRELGMMVDSDLKRPDLSLAIAGG